MIGNTLCSILLSYTAKISLRIASSNLTWLGDGKKPTSNLGRSQGDWWCSWASWVMSPTLSTLHMVSGISWKLCIDVFSHNSLNIDNNGHWLCRKGNVWTWVVLIEVNHYDIASVANQNVCMLFYIHCKYFLTTPKVAFLWKGSFYMALFLS